MADPVVIDPNAAAPVAGPVEPIAPAAAPVHGGTGDAAAVAPVASPPGQAEAAPPLASERPSLLETFLKEGDGEPGDKALKPAAEPAKPEPDATAKPAEAKPAEPVKPAADAPKPEAEAPKPAEAAPPVVAPFEPVKYEFEMPDGLRADAAKVDAFTGILNEAKLPAELGKDVGQKLLGLHNEAAAEYRDFLAREQHRVFNETRDNWNKDVLAHPEIGGAGHVTAMRAIARVRDAVISSAAPGTPQYEADAAAYEDFLRVTGAGDHPAHLAMMHRMAKFIDEPQHGDLPPRIGVPPTNGIKPGNFKQVMYDNPRSTHSGRG